MKNEKKNGVENELGYCPTVSQYNGKLYCDTTDCWVCCNTKKKKKKLYCDRSSRWARVRCIAREGIVL